MPVTMKDLKGFTVDICGDENCINCRMKILIGVAEALVDAMTILQHVPKSNRMVYDMNLASCLVAQDSDMSLKDLLESVVAAYAFAESLRVARAQSESRDASKH